VVATSVAGVGVEVDASTVVVVSEEVDEDGEFTTGSVVLGKAEESGGLL
jgi:hypothetical protein